ncbi:hypothetical protein, partial [Aeromonas caviae]|uniref:hypothetical protein n=1 Tax=Aeromonas caviae TaxID=648 RepID=UPI001FC7FC3D
SGLKEGLCFSVIFPPVYEGVILSRDLIRWPNSLCHYNHRSPASHYHYQTTLACATMGRELQDAIYSVAKQMI